MTTPKKKAVPAKAATKAAKAAKAEAKEPPVTAEVPETGLPKRVHDLKNAVADVAGNLSRIVAEMDEFVRAEELTNILRRQQEDLARKLKKLESKLGFRSLVGFLVVLFLAAGFAWWGHTTSNDQTKRVVHQARSEARARAIQSCEDRDKLDQALREIVDKFNSQQGIDQAKLSPVTRQVLSEVAAASPPNRTVHDFVYAETPIADCSKLPKP